MSSPLPALNPARSPDLPIADASVIPLVRRAQHGCAAPPRGLPDDPERREDSTDQMHDQDDGLPTTLDGNPLAVADRLTAAPMSLRLARHPAGAAQGQTSVDTAAGRLHTTQAEAGHTASPPLRRAARMGSPPVPGVTTRASAAQPQPQLLPINPSRSAPGSRGSLSLTADAAANAAETQTAAITAASSRMAGFVREAPAHIPEGEGDAGGPSARAPYAGLATEHNVDAPPAWPAAHPRARRAGEAAPPPLQPAGRQVDARGRTPLRAEGPAAGPRDTGTALIGAHLSQGAHAVAGSAARPSTVSVPFRSWGPGHQVTASWMPSVLSGLTLPSITLRGSTESAQRAVGSALDAEGRPDFGSLQILAADSADDDTPGRRSSRHVPEDDE